MRVMSNSLFGGVRGRFARVFTTLPSAQPRANLEPVRGKPTVHPVCDWTEWPVRGERHHEPQPNHSVRLANRVHAHGDGAVRLNPVKFTVHIIRRQPIGVAVKTIQRNINDMHGFWISSTEPLNFSAAQRALTVIEQSEAVLAVWFMDSSFSGHAEVPNATRPHRRVQQPVLK